MKYHNKPIVIDGIYFPSQKQGARYQELKLMERAGVIEQLRCEVPYNLDVNKKRVAVYRADFVYLENGKEIVEDVKGVRTPVYRLKAKLMHALYGIQIRET